MLNKDKKHFKIGFEVLEYHLGKKIYQYSKHFKLLNVYDSINSVTKETLINSNIPNRHIPKLIDDTLPEIHDSISFSCQNVQNLTLGSYWTNLDIVELYDLYSAFIIGTENTDKFVIRNTETLYTKLRSELLSEFPEYGKQLHKSLFDEFKSNNSVKNKYLKFFIGFAFEFKIANQMEVIESFSETTRAIIYADIRYHYFNEFFEFEIMEKESHKYIESNLHTIYNDPDMTSFEDIENVWHLENWLTIEENNQQQ